MHLKNYILIVLLGVLHISCKNNQAENVTKTPNIIWLSLKNRYFIHPQLCQNLNIFKC